MDTKGKWQTLNLPKINTPLLMLVDNTIPVPQTYYGMLNSNDNWVYLDENDEVIGGLREDEKVIMWRYLFQEECSEC